MKKTLTCLLVMALVGLVCSTAMAASDFEQTATCTVTKIADDFQAPIDVTLTCARKATVDSTPAGTITYGTEESTRDVTVVASGAGVALATLSMTSTDLSQNDTLLITGSGAESAVTLATDVTPVDVGTTLADDIVLTLDASAVVAGTAGLGTPWGYTLTYTLADLGA